MNWNKYLRAGIIGGVLLLTITPLLVANTLFFPFITGKAFFFRSLVEIMFGLWLVLLVLEPNYRFSFKLKRSAILWSVLAFAVAVTLATIFSQNPYKSFWSNFERMEGLLTYLHLVAYFLVAASVLKTQKLWGWLAHTSLAVSLLTAFIALSQFVCYLSDPLTRTCALAHQGFDRVDATLGNPAYYAVYLLIHIFLLLFFVFKDSQAKGSRLYYQLGYGLAALFEIFILILTGTRGAFIGIFVGLVLALVLIVIGDRANRGHRQVAGALLILMLVLGGGFWGLRHTNLVQSHPLLARFANISATDQTVESRLTIWGMSLKSLNEHPVFGWGPEAYNIVFNKYYEPKLWRQEQWFDRSHNVIFDWLVTTGILGLGAYLALIISALLVIWRERAKLSFAGSSVLVGLLVAYSIHNFFVFDNLSSYILFFSLLAYLYSQYGPEREVVKAKISASKEVAVYSMAVVSLVATVTMLYFFNYKPYVASTTLIKALSAQTSLDTNLNYFQQIFDGNTFAFDETTEQMFQFALRVAGSPEVKTNTGQTILKLAYDKMKEETEREPYNARGWYFLGSYLGRFGQFDQALTYIDKALALSPKKQTMMFEKVSILSAKGDMAQALVVAKQAFDLDPNFVEARKVYGLLALASGNQKLASEILVPAFGTVAVDDDRFINYFVSEKRFDQVLVILQAREKANPNDADVQISLGAAYFKLGDRQAAISHIQKAITLNPAYKDQGQKAIDDIRAGRSPQ